MSTDANYRLLDGDLDRFVARLRQRLDVGAQTYGSASFTRPMTGVVDEVMQELEDVAGWAVLLWARLDRVRARVAELGEGGTQ
jgi:hypothetical protein